MKEVYTIGLVRWKDDRSDAHCNSVYSSLEKAKLCAEKDGSFLSDDGYYQYLVIEKVPLDKPYGISHMQLWYKYDRGCGLYTETLTPDFAKCIVGWSVG